MAGDEWTRDEEKVERYLRRADEFPHRAEGEGVMLEHVPGGARRIPDLGTGDGRLLDMLRIERPDMVGVGVDFSELMLEAARRRFAAAERIELVEHDLSEPLPSTLGRFDAVVSSIAIHHLKHERKRSLYREVLDLLEPGGVFANFEHVASPTPRLHRAFFEAIDEPIENADPSDRLLDGEPSSAGCASSALTTSIATGSARDGADDRRPPGCGRLAGRPGGAGATSIGVPGFEPGTSATQRRRATRLRHTPRRPV